MTLTVISHHKCRQHKVPDWFSERPERLDAINNQLISSGLDYCIKHLDAPKVATADLLRVHSAEYLAELAASIPDKGFNMLSDDLPLSPQSLIAAEYAAGASVQAVNEVMQGRTDAVFCNVRPPGHHAEREQALGFCYYNNIAIAAAYALEHYQLERIAIIDFDVHHGNGTEQAFTDDSRVLFTSIFQDQLFPPHIYPSNINNVVNVPMAQHTTGDIWRELVECEILPKLRYFNPQLILISAGFDAHVEDDISSIGLVDDDYAWISQAVRAIADSVECCHGIVSCLEGGYHLSALARSVVAHIKAIGKLS